MGRSNLVGRKSWGAPPGNAARVAAALADAAADNAAGVDAVTTKLRQLLQRWDALATEQDTARILDHTHGRDLEADQLMTGLHDDVLALTRQSRGHAPFSQLFPDALWSALKLALESELPALRAMLALTHPAAVPRDPRTPGFAPQVPRAAAMQVRSA